MQVNPQSASLRHNGHGKPTCHTFDAVSHVRQWQQGSDRDAKTLPPLDEEKLKDQRPGHIEMLG